MEAITLQVTQGKYPDAKSARKAGRVPMAYYGKGFENLNFSADYQDFRRAYLKGGKSTIINLVNENKKEFASLIHDIQLDPLKDTYIHADMLAVDLNKPIHAEIPLVLVGTAPAVKEHGGVLVHTKDSVSVKCLPKDLVHEIQVDVSQLKELRASITVGQIQIPPGIQILDTLEQNVATISAPRQEEEEPVAVVAASEVPVAGAEEKKEGEEAAAAEPKEKKSK